MGYGLGVANVGDIPMLHTHFNGLPYGFGIARAFNIFEVGSTTHQPVYTPRGGINVSSNSFKGRFAVGNPNSLEPRP